MVTSMKPRIRAISVLVLFLLILGVIEATDSRMFDLVIEALVWVAVLVGSVAIFVRNRRTSRDIGFHFGQLGALPRSWRRWVLDEKNPRG
jgi:alpha-amylase/alpha-mannosidase (GH57 family)